MCSRSILPHHTYNREVKELNRFVSIFFRNVVRTFTGTRLIWHLFAIGLTYVLIVSGFDWAYYLSMQRFYDVLIWAGPLGFIVPLSLPFIVFALGLSRSSVRIRSIAYAIFQSQVLALVVAAFYKALTGRAHPDMLLPRHLVDITREFHFGFLQGGVFWGWPSSHTAVAFALAGVLWVLLPKHNAIRIIALIYALYIGIGVAGTFHWFSDFAAGAVLGTLIGVIVGKSYLASMRK